jgi:hypothetical protein
MKVVAPVTAAPTKTDDNPSLTPIREDEDGPGKSKYDEDDSSGTETTGNHIHRVHDLQSTTVRDLQKFGQSFDRRKKGTSTQKQALIPTRDRFGEGKSAGDQDNASYHISGEGDSYENDNASRSGSYHSEGSYNGSDRQSHSGSHSGSDYQSSRGNSSDRNRGSHDESKEEENSYCDTVSHHSFQSFHSINSFDIDNVDSLLPGNDQMQEAQSDAMSLNHTVSKLAKDVVNTISMVAMSKRHVHRPKEQEEKGVLVGVEEGTVDAIVEPLVDDVAVPNQESAKDDEDQWIGELLDQHCEFNDFTVDNSSQLSVGHQSRRHSTMMGFDLLRQAKKSVFE